MQSPACTCGFVSPSDEEAPPVELAISVLWDVSRDAFTPPQVVDCLNRVLPELEHFLKHEKRPSGLILPGAEPGHVERDSCCEAFEDEIVDLGKFVNRHDL